METISSDVPTDDYSTREIEEYAGLAGLSQQLQSAVIERPKGWSDIDTIESVQYKRRSLEDQLQITACAPPPSSSSISSSSSIEGTSSIEEESDSFIDAIVNEFYSWGAWLWNTVNPWASGQVKQDGSEVISDKNKDGSVNPFADRRPMSSEERAQYRKQVAEMNKLFDKLRELLGDDQFETIMYAIIQESIRARKESSELNRDKMVSTYEKKIKLSKKQHAESEKLLKTIRHQSWFTLYDEIATTVGLSAAAALAVGSGGWGMVALVYAIGTTYNRYSGHALEKQIGRGTGWVGSTLFGWNANKIEGNVSATLKTGTGLINAAITLGLGKFGNWITVMMQGTQTIVGLYFKRQSNQSQSVHFELGEDLKKQNKALAGSFKKQTDNLQRQSQDQERAAKLVTKASEISQEMIRGG